MAKSGKKTAKKPARSQGMPGEMMDRMPRSSSMPMPMMDKPRKKGK